VISIISQGDYQIESFIPEADISKIKIRNKASTTLDAYGSNVVFDTAIIKIDPAATVIDGVPTYKVTLRFMDQDSRIKSGMTANLDILTNQKDNVLLLPNRVLITEDDGKYVSILNPDGSGKILLKKIVVGLRGSDGNTEIISGLNEGDKVLLPQ
jgi:HlyD family secretion protein